MNKRILVFVLLPFFLLLACSEIPPNIDLGGSDDDMPGPLNDNVQKVLIEEFTGVRCVNCPAGSELIEQLLDIHGDRLIAISIHAGNFATPYPDSEHDFEIEDGLSVMNFLGQPTGFPTAVVDRKIFDGEEEIQLQRAKWAGFIDQQLAREATIDIDLEGDISDSGLMNITASINFVNPDPAEQYKFTLLVTENNIEDPQETPDGIVSDYKHKHVLRDIITPFNGEDIATEAATLNFNDYVIPEGWEKSELSIIAIVHNSSGDKAVQQVEEFKF